MNASLKIRKMYREDTGKTETVGSLTNVVFTDDYVFWLECELNKLHKHIVSNNEVRVAVCSECDNYNNSQGSKICRNCYQKSHFVEQTDC